MKPLPTVHTVYMEYPLLLPQRMESPATMKCLQTTATEQDKLLGDCQKRELSRDRERCELHRPERCGNRVLSNTEPLWTVHM